MADYDVPPELGTIADCIRYAASHFEAAGLHYGHGTDNAVDEAAALVLHVAHLPDLHEAYFCCRLTAAEKAAVMAAVRRRIEERLPLPYITGEAWFMGLSFRVDRRVLVPRSPIAELIERGFAPWAAPENVERVVDIGTGSGCIAVACALALPRALVDAVDVSVDALALARENVARHRVEDRVALIHSDLFEAVPAGRRYNVIVANPPYVSAAGMAALPPEYGHEPRGALAAGEDGLDCAHRLLRQAAERLTEQGVLVCEVGGRAAALEAAYPEMAMTWVELEQGGEGVFVVGVEDLRRQFKVQNDV